MKLIYKILKTTIVIFLFTIILSSCSQNAGYDWLLSRADTTGYVPPSKLIEANFNLNATEITGGVNFIFTDSVVELYTIVLDFDSPEVGSLTQIREFSGDRTGRVVFRGISSDTGNVTGKYIIDTETNKVSLTLSYLDVTYNYDVEFISVQKINRTVYLNSIMKFQENVVSDADGDGTPDDADACPNDPAKAESAGDCGCGVADTDTDGDGIADCNDTYPEDFDNDGVATADDCNDEDENIAGPAIWYQDLDGDMLGDSAVSKEACTKPEGYVGEAGDECPNDNNKTSAGNCGCGVADTDTDGDGIADCNDTYPEDFDNDGVATSDDCNDEDENIAGPAIWYQDLDGDMLGDIAVTLEACTKPEGYVSIAGDECPNDNNKTTAGDCGCGNTEESCKDCAGVTNGTSFLDNCDKCVTTLEEVCEQDCNGDWGGTAALDACEKCAGGNTGIPPATNPDDCFTTATNKITKKENIKIYPNPATSVIHLEGVLEEQWELYNLFGGLLKKGTGAEIKTDELSSGIYLIKVGSYTTRFSIK